MARLKNMYREQVAPALMQKFEYSSVMQIPRFDKIVINIGAGDAKENSKVIENIIRDLTIISGQKPVYTKAKKSIANFTIILSSSGRAWLSRNLRVSPCAVQKKSRSISSKGISPVNTRSVSPNRPVWTSVM